MGLFNKQDAVVKEIAKKEKEKVKQESENNPEPDLLSGKRLGSWIYQPALAIVLLAAALIAGIEFVVVQQAEEQQAQQEEVEREVEAPSHPEDGDEAVVAAECGGAHHGGNGQQECPDDAVHALALGFSVRQTPRPGRPRCRRGAGLRFAGFAR